MKNTLFSKPVLSPFIAVSFILVSLTGFLLFFHVKLGPILILHEWFGWALMIGGVAHLIHNWKALLAYFKLRKAVASFSVAVVLAGLLSYAGLAHDNYHKDHPRGERPASSSRESLGGTFRLTLCP